MHQPKTGGPEPIQGQPPVVAFFVRVPAQLHGHVKSQAALCRISMTDWLIEAAEEKLARDRRKVRQFPGTEGTE